MARVKIGKANYGGGQRKFEKLKDGEAVYGVLPPLGDLADEGRWSVYYQIHYGYKNPAGKSRPFQSCLVKNRKTKMIDVPDAAIERLDMLKAQLEKAKKAGDEKAKEALFKLVGGQKSIYNLDNNHYINAIDLQGNIVILKLRHKAKLALDEEIKKLRKRGIEPLGLENRRFFLFSRSGSGQDTMYKVSVYTQSITATLENGQKVEAQQEVVHSLTDDVLDRLGSEAGKLDQLFKTPTAEQVEQIVRESMLTTGVSANIDIILGNTINAASNEEAIEDESESDETEETTLQTTVNTTVTTPPVTVVATPESTATVTAPTQTATVFAQTPAASVKTTSTPPTTTEKLAEMSDAEFLKSLGISG